jgi:drug/metabolite transporter (DMT)-like permease
MALSDNMRGALAMTLAMVAFTVNDAFMKLLGESLPLFQTIFLRGVGATLLLIVLTVLMGQWRLNLPRADWVRMIVRGLAEALGAWSFLFALFHMPIADLSAILQALPLTVALAGALFLGEAIGWRRLSAILIGFAGVMLIIRPGGEGFSVYSLSGLGCVAAVTVRDLVSRRLTAGTPTMMVAVTSAVIVTAFAGVASVTEDWRPLAFPDLLHLAGAIGFLMVGYASSIQAMRVGDIAFVAPFRYTSLIAALVLGVLFFDTFPDELTLLGATIVVATGLFTLYRESVRKSGR